MNAIKYALSFILGVSCGSAGTLLLVKKHYENKADREISESRRAFHRLLKERAATNNTEEKDAQKDAEELNDRPIREKKTYANLVSSLGYDPQISDDDDGKEPQLINEDDFKRSIYPKAYLAWFEQEGLLVDEKTGAKYDELEDLLGEDGLEMICDPNAESFWMKNYKLRLDIRVTIYRDQVYDDVYATN